MSEVFEPMHLHLPAFSALLQPAGAFLKQASLLESDMLQAATTTNMKNTPSQVSVAATTTDSATTQGESSFLAAMRKGLENLVQVNEEEEDDDDDDDDDDEDDDMYGGYVQKTIPIENPPLYSSNYLTIPSQQVRTGSINQDDELIFQMDM